MLNWFPEGLGYVFLFLAAIATLILVLSFESVQGWYVRCIESQNRPHRVTPFIVAIIILSTFSVPVFLVRGHEASIPQAKLLVAEIPKEPDPKKWLYVKLSNLHFIPNSYDVLVLVRVDNRINVDVMNLGIDIRFANFSTSKEWKETHGKRPTPLHTRKLLRGGEWFQFIAKYGVGTRNPKGVYCSKDRKPLMVWAEAAWKDERGILFENDWPYRARCNLEDDSVEPNFEKKKFHFSLYPEKPNWFGGN